MENLKARLNEVAVLDNEKVPAALLNIAEEVASGVMNGQTDNAAQLLIPRIVQVLSKGVGTGKERLTLGEVLGQLGDPRILTPRDDAYWVDVPYDGNTIVIGRFPVTNAEYRAWVDGGGYDDKAAWSADGWEWLQSCDDPWPVNAVQEGVEPFVVPNQPVVGVTYHEAVAYAKAHSARLPRQDERVWVCRGKERRPYPWGSPFGEGNANTQEEVLGRPCAVGLYIKDCTPEGVQDLAGNVAEWTEDEVGEMRLIHPGAWDQPSLAAWAKAIELKAPSDRGAGLGFRLSREARKS
ncbi:MAG: formylglycine-generating enzyme family protein [Myxococcales bacterium]|nr:formylglycine-generating enzyme family protein [Myxococcales bacterium]